MPIDYSGYPTAGPLPGRLSASGRFWPARAPRGQGTRPLDPWWSGYKARIVREASAAGTIEATLLSCYAAVLTLRPLYSCRSPRPQPQRGRPPTESGSPWRRGQVAAAEIQHGGSPAARVPGGTLGRCQALTARFGRWLAARCDGHRSAATAVRDADPGAVVCRGCQQRRFQTFRPAPAAAQAGPGWAGWPTRPAPGGAADLAPPPCQPCGALRPVCCRFRSDGGGLWLEARAPRLGNLGGSWCRLTRSKFAPPDPPVSRSSRRCTAHRRGRLCRPGEQLRRKDRAASSSRPISRLACEVFWSNAPIPLALYQAAPSTAAPYRRLLYQRARTPCCRLHRNVSAGEAAKRQGGKPGRSKATRPRPCAAGATPLPPARPA